MKRLFILTLLFIGLSACGETKERLPLPEMYTLDFKSEKEAIFMLYYGDEPVQLANGVHVHQGKKVTLNLMESDEKYTLKCIDSEDSNNVKYVYFTPKDMDHSRYKITLQWNEDSDTSAVIY